MPPKKRVVTEGADGADTGGAFRWTLENERKLLILTQGRYLTAEDYERLLTVFPGTNLTGVRIKVSRFRVEQRNLYNELCWELPQGGAIFKSGGGGKRKAVDKKDGDEGSETPTKSPTKKPRAKKGAAKKEVKSNEKVEDDDEGVGSEVKCEDVKEEQFEDEM